MELRSSAFVHQGEIPRQHTCDGEDRSPPLAWSGVPAGTKSLALIVDDPDAPDPKAPKRVYVHWVLYNIPPDAAGLAEAIRPADLPAGTLEGLNDWGRTGYGGPCPPIGRHRYFHKLYALDTVLPGPGAPDESAAARGDGGARPRRGAARGDLPAPASRPLRAARGRRRQPPGARSSRRRCSAPCASPGSAASAASTPRARRSTYGSVALVSANVEVRGTSAGMLVTP